MPNLSDSLPACNGIPTTNSNPQPAPDVKAGTTATAWTAEAILAHLRQRLFQDELVVHDGWELMPAVGPEHRQALVQALTADDLAVLVARLVLENHDLPLPRQPGPKDDQLTARERLRRDKRQAALRWGRCCSPAWSDEEIDELLAEVARIRRGRNWARSLGWGLRTAAQLAEVRPEPAWVIENFLVEMEPAVIGGPIKVLKTALAVDLAISVASGRPFLNRFAVATPRPVVFFSGESSEPVLASLAKRVSESKGIRFGGQPVTFVGAMFALTSPEQLARLGDLLQGNRGALVIFDPLYLGLADADGGSMFSMGPALACVAEVCRDAKCTPVIVHHFTKEVGPGPQLPELRQLAYAGLDQFARCWLLVRPRRAYGGDGRHCLARR